MYVNIRKNTGIFARFVYVWEFIGHTVNGNEFYEDGTRGAAPPRAGTRKHVIQSRMDAQEKANTRTFI